MKINDFYITKWYHWLVAVIVLTLLAFLALLLAEGIICWACRPANNVTTSDYVKPSPDYPAEAYPRQSDNHTVIIIFNSPHHPVSVEIPSKSENITISWPSDNCTPSG